MLYKYLFPFLLVLCFLFISDTSLAQSKEVLAKTEKTTVENLVKPFVKAQSANISHPYDDISFIQPPLVNKRWEKRYQLEGEDFKEVVKVIYFYPSRQMKSKGYYKGKEKDGYWMMWYENGQKMAEHYFQDRQPHGEWKEWYKNGQLKYIHHYEDGFKAKTWVEWYENKQKKAVITFKKGMRNGRYQQWYRNGKMQVIGSYEFGDKHGTWATWRKNGKLDGRTVYERGKIVQ